MASHHLAARTKQPGHDRTFQTSEQSTLGWVRTVCTHLSQALGIPLVVEEKPTLFLDIFTWACQPPESALGIQPELAILNLTDLASCPFLLLEVKKQGPQGNAEERAFRLFTAKFQENLRQFVNDPTQTARPLRSGTQVRLALAPSTPHPYRAVFCEHLARERRYTQKFAALLDARDYALVPHYTVADFQRFASTLLTWMLDQQVLPAARQAEANAALVDLFASVAAEIPDGSPEGQPEGEAQAQAEGPFEAPFEADEASALAGQLACS